MPDYAKPTIKLTHKLTSNSLINFYGELWVYTLYITLACLVTSGLNIFHTKYILGIELSGPLFIAPIIAGILFGYLSAHIRLSKPIIYYPGDVWIFLKYILFSCFVTATLNIVHTDWVMNTKLKPELFIAPVIAGLFFGYLLAKIKTLNNRLMQLATTDVLTQTYNRMQFDNFLTMEIDRVNRYGGTFSVIFFDVDNFKRINDQFGHPVGDDVLTSLADLVKQHNRRTDIFARYGGEEFVILTNSIDRYGALNYAQRLRKGIQQTYFEQIGNLTCSFGVAEFKKGQDTAQSIMKAADEALYRAKQNGRNCVEAV